MESNLWESWVSDHNPSEFLTLKDHEIEAGKYASRKAAFLDFAEHAIRVLYPDAVEDWTPETLAAALLAYAEANEQGASL